MKVPNDQDVYAVTCGGEHRMKVPNDHDVYAVTCGGEHGEGDGCDKEGGGASQEGHHGPEVGVPLQELQLLHLPKKKISDIKYEPFLIPPQKLGKKRKCQIEVKQS